MHEQDRGWADRRDAFPDGDDPGQRRAPARSRPRSSASALAFDADIAVFDAGGRPDRRMPARRLRAAASTISAGSTRAAAPHSLHGAACPTGGMSPRLRPAVRSGQGRRNSFRYLALIAAVDRARRLPVRTPPDAAARGAQRGREAWGSGALSRRVPSRARTKSPPWPRPSTRRPTASSGWSRPTARCWPTPAMSCARRSHRLRMAIDLLRQAQADPARKPRSCATSASSTDWSRRSCWPAASTTSKGSSGARRSIFWRCRGGGARNGAEVDGPIDHGPGRSACSILLWCATCCRTPPAMGSRR